MSNQLVVNQTDSDTGTDIMAPVNALKRTKAMLAKVMSDILKPGVHYATVIKDQKPSLLKAGAECICNLFRLSPTYKVKKVEMGDGHREYVIVCTMTNINDETMWGQGVGSATTLEQKWRYMRDKKTGNRIEHPNIEDLYNTVFKIAKKRALVDAVLTTTAASDYFTQDLEEITISDISPHPKPKPPPPPPPPPPKPAPPPPPPPKPAPKPAPQPVTDVTDRNKKAIEWLDKYNFDTLRPTALTRAFQDRCKHEGVQVYDKLNQLRKTKSVVDGSNPPITVYKELEDFNSELQNTILEA